MIDSDDVVAIRYKVEDLVENQIPKINKKVENLEKYVSELIEYVKTTKDLMKSIDDKLNKIALATYYECKMPFEVINSSNLPETYAARKLLKRVNNQDKEDYNNRFFD